MSKDDSLYRSLANFDTTEILVGKAHVTFIEPPYNRIYRSGILPIIRGIIASSVELVELDDGKKVLAGVYGIFDSSSSTFKEQETSLLAVNVYRDFVSMLDDPKAALDAYHRNLIGQTNELLDAVESPYCLAQISD